MHAFHPDLAAARFMPRFSFGPASARFVRGRTPRPAPLPPEVTVAEIAVDGLAGSPPVSIRVIQPAGRARPAPALLWVHGGGMILGSPEQDDRTNVAFALTLGITVAAVRYRLSPDNTAPAAVEDVAAAFLGLREHAERLGIDPERIAIGGASAGGGLSAAATLMLHDRGGAQPVFQLLVYPMLDDRTVMRDDIDARNLRAWTPKSNRYGWTAYLGEKPGGPEVSPYAAPARRESLTGLPPAWIGVGTLDLFHDEDVEYARRLQAAGVPCSVHVVPGAFHGFDTMFPRAGVTQSFWEEQATALRAALWGEPR